LSKRPLLLNACLVLGLGILLLAFFYPAVLGGRTLLPLDNLFAFEPWRSFAAGFGVETPHNELLSDLVLENYVWKRFIVEALRERELPLWNPYILSGQPFLANGQHSALYPLSLVFYVIPLVEAYGLFTVLQLALAAVFMYAYARTIGQSRLGGAVAAVTFALSGFMVVSVVHPMIIAAASWLPLVLAVVERLIRTQEEQTPEQRARPVAYIPWIAAGAIALGLQFLAGHLEIAYYVVLVTIFYGACRLGVYWRSTRSNLQTGKLVLALGIMVALGVGLAAVQMIPYYEVVAQNFRQGSATYQQVIDWAYKWRRLIAFLVPDFFGNPTHHSYVDIFSGQTVSDLRNYYGQPIDTIYWGIKNYVEGGSYVGFLPLVLAALAVWKHRTRYVRIFLALAVLSLAFVFGTPLYALLFYGLPGINQLHSPFRWVFPYTLSISVLAGCGATWLASTLSLPDKRNVRRLALALFASALVGLGGLALSLQFPGEVSDVAERVMLGLAKAPEAFADGRAFFSYQFRNLAIFLSAVCGAGVSLWLAAADWRVRSTRIWPAVALGVAAAELFVLGSSFHPAADPGILELTPPAVRFLQQDASLWRFTTLDAPNDKTLNANSGMFFDLQDVRGYDSIISRQYVEFMGLLEPQGELLYNRVAPLTRESTLDSPLLDLLNVKYVVTTQRIDRPGYRVAYDGEVRVYENEGCLPRAFVVGQARVLPDPQERKEALLGLRPQREVILEEAPSPGVPADASGLWMPAEIVSYGVNEVLIQVDLAHGGYLVLSDAYFPGWKAYDTRPGESEQEIPLLRANGAFRAVALGSGEHVVRFKYTPLSLKLALFVSFLAAVVVLLLMGLWAWRRVYTEESGTSAIRRVAKNALTPMLLNLLNRVVDMAFAMLYLRILAPAGAGRYDFAVNFIGYFETAVLFGLGTWVTREMSKHPGDANRYWSNAVLLRLLLWLASLPVMALTLLVYIRVSGVATDTLVAIALFSGALVPGLVSDAFSAAFYAHERMEYPAAISSVTTLLRVTIGTIFLLLGYGFVSLAATSFLVSLMAAILLGFFARRLLFRPRLHLDRQFGMVMLRDSFPLMINNLLSKVFFMSDVLLLKPIRGDTEVGYYSAAYRFIRGLDVIPSYFTLAIFPLISRFAESGRDSLVRAYVVSVKLLVMLAVPIAVGTTFVAEELILILAGPAFLPQSRLALQVLIWYMPVGFINSVTHYVLIAIGKQRFLTRAFVFGAAFNILSNLALIPRYGYVAAAAVTALSELALLIPFYYCVRNNLGSLPWLDIFWRPACAAAAMAAVMAALQGISVALAVPAGAVTYLTALMLLGTFRQPDLALLYELLPLRLRQALRLTAPEP